LEPLKAALEALARNWPHAADLPHRANAARDQGRREPGDRPPEAAMSSIAGRTRRLEAGSSAESITYAAQAVILSLWDLGISHR
jgi:hypothetical protein